MSQETFKLKLYPLAAEEFIGTIDVQQTPKQDTSLVETIIILDKSTSMADQARRVTNEIIPLFLSKLSYDEKQVIHFITFDTVSALYSKSIEDIKKLGIGASGYTIMAPAVTKCQEVFGLFVNYSKPVRLLTISDGEVQDMDETQAAAQRLVEFLKNHDFTINSQAVRLFTSSSQPDTKAVASLLQINNITSSLLADISSTESNDAIAEKIADLFRNDNLANSFHMTTKNKIVIKFPWEPQNTSSNLSLTSGDNLFWLKAVPSNEIKVSGNSIEVKVENKLTLLGFQDLMKKMLNFIVDQMKISKVIGTPAHEQKIKEMLQYFEKTEEELMKKSLFPNLHQKKISKVLALIANDQNVKNLDQAQKAEYLRQAGFTAEEPTWVEKAFNVGVDIDDLLGNKNFVAAFMVVIALFYYLFFL